MTSIVSQRRCFSMLHKGSLCSYYKVILALIIINAIHFHTLMTVSGWCWWRVAESSGGLFNLGMCIFLARYIISSWNPQGVFFPSLSFSLTLFPCVHAHIHVILDMWDEMRMRYWHLNTNKVLWDLKFFSSATFPCYCFYIIISIDIIQPFVCLLLFLCATYLKFVGLHKLNFGALNMWLHIPQIWRHKIFKTAPV